MKPSKGMMVYDRDNDLAVVVESGADYANNGVMVELVKCNCGRHLGDDHPRRAYLEFKYKHIEPVIHEVDIP